MKKILCTLLVLMLSAQLSFAAGGGEFNLALVDDSVTAVKAGETVSINVMLYSTQTSGIDAFQADLTYDESLFTLESFTKNEDFYSLTYSQPEGIIRIVYLDVGGSNTINPQKRIATLVFKAMADVPSTSTSFGFLTANDATSILYHDDTLWSPATVNALSLTTVAAPVQVKEFRPFVGVYNKKLAVVASSDGSANYTLGELDGAGAFYYSAAYGGYVSFVNSAETLSTLLPSFAETSGACEHIEHGKVNSDNVINTVDAVLIQRIYNQSFDATDKARLAADFNADYSVDAVDCQGLVDYYLHH